MREGEQWKIRREVTTRAEGEWSDWCTVAREELSEPEFLAEVENHAFVFCVEGGGLDPSPKAWQAILHGAIPIIRKTGTYRAYAELPVAFVPDWRANCFNPECLKVWRNHLAPYYDEPALRASTLTRLGLDYWWRKISTAKRILPSNTSSSRFDFEVGRLILSMIVHSPVLTR
ncbi:hypothetical protein [Sulfitobacter delicatus]|uniref:hypothetical protein n=1 Tax=Sulfitobacter delicatus TaxID=218672 RepID=UPI001113DB6E|nr:hypothetical protein [Sulfitobacter delicatus]